MLFIDTLLLALEMGMKQHNCFRTHRAGSTALAPGHV